jgi:hypothetical protein
MNPGWTLFLEIVGAIASIVVILDYFGIKPEAGAWGVIMALNQKWKLVIMLLLVGLSVAFSGYGFFRALRPKIVERVVEKPVEKIVEKVVPQECPPVPSATLKHSTKPKRSPQSDTLKGKTVTKTDAPSEPPIKQDCGGGNCAASVGQQGGVTAGQINVNGPLPPVYTFTEEVVPGTDGRKKINVHIHTDRAVRGAIVGMLFTGPIDYVQSNNPSVTNAGLSQQSWGQLKNKNGLIPNTLFVTVNEPTIFLTNQDLIVPVTSQTEVHVLRVFPVDN